MSSPEQVPISDRPLLDRCIDLINSPDAYLWALSIYGTDEEVRRRILVDPAAHDRKAFLVAKEMLRAEAASSGENFDDIWGAAQAWYDAMKVTA
jgi:hypothetical protein